MPSLQEHVDANVLPTPSQLSEASALVVYDERGEKISFGNLVQLPSSESLTTPGDNKRVPDVPAANPTENGARNGNGKVAVVFIRHFMCGVCQAYVQNLTRVPPEALQKAGAALVIVGCGEWEALKTYRGTFSASQITGFKGPIYADPSRALYHTLGMTYVNLETTPAGEAKPSYLDGSSRLGNLFQSVWRAVSHPKLIGNSGNMSQNGGEFVFEDGNCVYASRMRHTEDHIPAVKLMQLLGVEYSEGGGEEQKPIP
ncbi:AhpC/TSA antioxidant enzyme-domain-containing protein [Coprinopsis sp. MPI-PUGE-AT-0042]|nr:AhpC/TSA antioxidant enzyme-domain-containing protein [Coprinopsis sp. MPI-PUGE-AT-0042]